MQWSVTVPPEIFPITTKQALDQARIDDIESNRSWIADAIADATATIETETQLSFITRTITAVYYPIYDDFTPLSIPFPPYACLELYRPPVQNIISITDGQGNEVNNYLLRKVGYKDSVQLQSSVVGPVTIIYEAGYGLTADAVPSDIKRAIVALVAHSYRFREADADSIPVGIQYICEKYRSGGVG
jgi:uncharacterized phiE125 gp8 family phage protein